MRRGWRARDRASVLSAHQRIHCPAPSVHTIVTPVLEAPLQSAQLLHTTPTSKLLARHHRALQSRLKKQGMWYRASVLRRRCAAAVMQGSNEEPYDVREAH